MNKLRILLAATLLLVSFGASAEITFRRAGVSSRDTVYNNKYYVVCITDPGNLAAVNGQQVRVYKTGAFGREITLQKGENPIEITLFQGTQVETKKFSIYYEEARRERVRPLEPVVEDRLFYVQTKENAALLYSAGTDRLGGSKMGFLDPGIVLKVVGEVGNLYKEFLVEERPLRQHQQHRHLESRRLRPDPPLAPGQTPLCLQDRAGPDDRARRSLRCHEQQQLGQPVQ